MQLHLGVNYEEFLVGEALEKRRWHVYVPTKDVGIDLLAERDNRIVRVQVKGSRTFMIGGEYVRWSSWTQLGPDALGRATSIGVDFVVFVVHAPDESGHRARVVPFFVIISPADLEARLAAYRPGKTDRAVYWWRDDDGRLWEVRGVRERKVSSSYRQAARDFTRHLDNWSLLDSGEAVRPTGRHNSRGARLTSGKT